MDFPASETSGPDELIVTLERGRRQFLALVEHVRPELHRYCTRMTGSVADGEDVVQETLARACYELSQLRALPSIRPWLFRIAHNRAIDHWRHEMHRISEPLDVAADIADEAAHEPDNVLARSRPCVRRCRVFSSWRQRKRGCVILKDVLEHSIDEIAYELGLSVPAVKAALHRGRETLQRLTQATPPAQQPRDVSPALKRYASLFNAHDWDGVRAMLADDVRLDLVSQRKAAGRREVATYFSNYERAAHWHLSPALLDGREVVAVLPEAHAGGPRYFIELGWDGDRVIAIRDFRHVPYIAQDVLFELAESTTHRSTP